MNKQIATPKMSDNFIVRFEDLDETSDAFKELSTYAYRVGDLTETIRSETEKFGFPVDTAGETEVTFMDDTENVVASNLARLKNVENLRIIINVYAGALRSMFVLDGCEIHKIVHSRFDGRKPGLRDKFVLFSYKRLTEILVEPT